MLGAAFWATPGGCHSHTCLTYLASTLFAAKAVAGPGRPWLGWVCSLAPQQNRRYRHCSLKQEKGGRSFCLSEQLSTVLLAEALLFLLRRGSKSAFLARER